MANLFVLGRFRQGKTSKVAFMKGMLTKLPRGRFMLTEQYVTRLLTSFMKRHYVTRLLTNFMKTFMGLTLPNMKGVQGELTGLGERKESKGRHFVGQIDWQCSLESTTGMGGGESKEEEPQAEALVQEVDISTSILHVNLKATLIVSICALLAAAFIVICLLCFFCRLQLCT